MIYTVVGIFTKVCVAFIAAVFVWQAWLVRESKEWIMAALAVALAAVCILAVGCAPRIPTEWPADSDMFHVIDGDTVKVGVRYGRTQTAVESVRFDCLNAESLKTPKGKAAADRLALLMAQGKSYSVIDSGRRSYGRIVGKVLIDGYDPQVVLSGEGLAEWTCQQ